MILEAAGCRGEMRGDDKKVRIREIAPPLKLEIMIVMNVGEAWGEEIGEMGSEWGGDRSGCMIGEDAVEAWRGWGDEFGLRIYFV